MSQSTINDGPRASVPMFRPPDQTPEQLQPVSPPEPRIPLRSPDPTEESPPFRGSDAPLGVRERISQLVRPGPRSSTSSDGDYPPTEAQLKRERKAMQIDPDLVTAAAGALATVFIVAGAIFVRIRYSGERKLRQPTDAQLDAFGKPVGSMMMRRAGMHKWGIDILEGLTAIAAAGNYVNDGPLTMPIDAQPSIFGADE